jgi:hypothetical protein
MPPTLLSSSEIDGSEMGFDGPASFADEDIFDRKDEDDDDDILG